VLLVLDYYEKYSSPPSQLQVTCEITFF
jgi:hypothetical protein